MLIFFFSENILESNWKTQAKFKKKLKRNLCLIFTTAESQRRWGWGFNCARCHKRWKAWTKPGRYRQADNPAARHPGKLKAWGDPGLGINQEVLFSAFFALFYRVYRWPKIRNLYFSKMYLKFFWENVRICKWASSAQFSWGFGRLIKFFKYFLTFIAEDMLKPKFLKKKASIIFPQPKGGLILRWFEIFTNVFYIVLFIDLTTPADLPKKSCCYSWKLWKMSNLQHRARPGNLLVVEGATTWPTSCWWNLKRRSWMTKRELHSWIKGWNTWKRSSLTHRKIW